MKKHITPFLIIFTLSMVTHSEGESSTVMTGKMISEMDTSSLSVDCTSSKILSIFHSVII